MLTMEMLNLKNLAKPNGAILRKCRVNKHSQPIMFAYAEIWLILMLMLKC